MFDLPPSYASIKHIYEQLPDKTKSQVKTKAFLVPSPSVKSNMVRAVRQRASDLTFGAQILEEVDILSDSVHRLDEAFESIKAKLGIVDTNNRPNTSYRATWKAYQKRWTDFFGRCRETAAMTERQITELLEVVLPLAERASAASGSEAIEDAQKALELFSRRHDPAIMWLDADDSHSHSKEYIKLKNDIDAFVGTFNEYAKAQNVTFTDVVSAKKAELTTVRAEITKCQTLLAGLERGAAVALFDLKTDSALVAARCGVLAPITGFSLVVAATKAAIADASAIQAEHTTLQEHIRLETRLNQQLARVERELSCLPGVTAALGDHQIAFAHVGGRMDQLGTIWGTTILQAQALRTFFHVDKDTDRVVISNIDGFTAHLGFIRAYQTSMRAGLGRYVVQTAVL